LQRLKFPDRSSARDQIRRDQREGCCSARAAGRPCSPRPRPLRSAILAHVTSGNRWASQMRFLPSAARRRSFRPGSTLPLADRRSKRLEWPHQPVRNRTEPRCRDQREFRSTLFSLHTRSSRQSRSRIGAGLPLRGRFGRFVFLSILTTEAGWVYTDHPLHAHVGGTTKTCLIVWRRRPCQGRAPRLPTPPPGHDRRRRKFRA
jgi:hypothetical protein